MGFPRGGRGTIWRSSGTAKMFFSAYSSNLSKFLSAARCTFSCHRSMPCAPAAAASVEGERRRKGCCQKGHMTEAEWTGAGGECETSALRSLRSPA